MTEAPADTALRVVVVLQYYRPHRTGLTLHVQHLAEALVADGHTVTVIAARHDDRYAPTAVERGVSVRRLWAPIRISRGMVAPGHPVAVWRALRDCDVVSVHTPLLETAIVGVICRLRRVPMVITHHGDLVLPPGRMARFVERIVAGMHRIGLRLAACTIVYSEDYLRVSSYVDRARPTAVISPPVEVCVPDPVGTVETRRRLAPSGGPLLLFAGRFVREKRPDLAIEALALVRRTHPDARLVFAGDFDIAYEDTWAEHAALVEAQRDALTFLGMIADPQELADLYAAADALVLTSDTECFGLVQVEAMLCGTPVVMTDIDGGRVPVQATGMGVLVEPGNAADVARGIEEVLADRAAYLVDAATVRERLRLDETYAAYEEVFRAAAH